MIDELVLLSVRSGLEAQFEASFRDARRYLMRAPGYLNHRLCRCIETPNRYHLHVQWTSVAAHEYGFRGSKDYRLWSQALHHYYEPLPVVEHYCGVDLEGSAK